VGVRVLSLSPSFFSLFTEYISAELIQLESSQNKDKAISGFGRSQKAQLTLLKRNWHL
jgi:hypothetical protein